MNITINKTRKHPSLNEMHTDAEINGELIEIVTQKNSNGCAVTSFKKYTVTNGFKVSNWSDFNCYKPVNHGKIARLTEKKVIELHESTLSRLCELLKPNKQDNFGVIAN